MSDLFAGVEIARSIHSNANSPSFQILRHLLPDFDFFVLLLRHEELTVRLDFDIVMTVNHILSRDLAEHICASVIDLVDDDWFLLQEQQFDYVIH